MADTSASDSLVPISIEVSEISSWLNSDILVTFLTGIYTVIYFGTLYMCHSKISQRRFIVATITMLYLVTMVDFGIGWWLMQWTFVDNGQTRDSIFGTVFNLPPGIHITTSILGFTLIVLADSLLVWRCYYIWNRSRRIIFLPLLLVFTETVLFIYTVIALCVEKLHPSAKLALTVNNMDGAGYFISAATSLATTFLIAYRVHFVVNNDSASRGRFKHVIEILVQSAAVYSLVMLTFAIAVVLPISQADTRFFAFENYNLFVPISGMAPTIMVARVCLAAGEDRRILTPGPNPLTTLAFRETVIETETRRFPATNGGALLHDA